MKRLLTLISFIVALVSATAQVADLTPAMTNPIKTSVYTVDYDEINKIPVMVSYYIIGNQLMGYGRYAFHSKLNNRSAVPRDYTYTGYDRGHMYPSGSSISYTSCYESFDMINILPQLPSFNRGIWSRIEEFEQSNCSPYCYVICGVLPITSNKYINRVRVPDGFYKVIYNPTLNQMIGFVVYQTSSGNIKKFTKTVDQIESLIKKDLFHQLPKSIQTKCEAKVNIESWTW